jgi:hypothetical protein
MNVTLSIDEAVLARVRELAARRGTSLNQMIREYLAELAGERSSQELIDSLDELWGRGAGNSGGTRWTRGELHERGLH